MHKPFGGLSHLKLVDKHTTKQVRAVSSDTNLPKREQESFTEPSERLFDLFLLATCYAQSLHAETERQPGRVAKGCHDGGTPYYAAGRRPAEVLR
ncbi:hypothetical protein SHO565_55570 [Streptomyces sp. HO565]